MFSLAAFRPIFDLSFLLASYFLSFRFCLSGSFSFFSRVMCLTTFRAVNYTPVSTVQSATSMPQETRLQYKQRKHGFLSLCQYFCASAFSLLLPTMSSTFCRWNGSADGRVFFPASLPLVFLCTVTKVAISAHAYFSVFSHVFSVCR